MIERFSGRSPSSAAPSRTSVWEAPTPWSASPETRPPPAGRRAGPVLTAVVHACSPWLVGASDGPQHPCRRWTGSCRGCSTAPSLGGDLGARPPPAVPEDEAQPHLSPRSTCGVSNCTTRPARRASATRQPCLDEQGRSRGDRLGGADITGVRADGVTVAGRFPAPRPGGPAGPAQVGGPTGGLGR
jgi:hypothetical protein